MKNSHKISPTFPQSCSLCTISLYQRIRPFIDQIYFSVFGFVYTCKHTPTCSQYMYNQILEHGTIHGIYRGCRRILSCH